MRLKCQHKPVHSGCLTLKDLATQEQASMGFVVTTAVCFIDPQKRGADTQATQEAPSDLGRAPIQLRVLVA